MAWFHFEPSKPGFRITLQTTVTVTTMRRLVELIEFGPAAKGSLRTLISRGYRAFADSPWLLAISAQAHVRSV
jgi:hypothetical protein